MFYKLKLCLSILRGYYTCYWEGEQLLFTFQNYHYCLWGNGDSFQSVRLQDKSYPYETKSILLQK